MSGNNIIDNRVFADLDYYAILEVNVTTSATEIKKKYVELALRYHPDKLGRPATDEDHTRFTQVQDAYEVLKDPEKRLVYDDYRAKPVNADRHVNREHAEDFARQPTIPEDALTANRLADLIPRIISAVFSKNIALLKQLLDEYKAMNVTEHEQQSVQAQFDWLLRYAASETATAIALLLIEFGANVNHYGEIIRKDGSDTFKCYFVDMLVYYDCTELFKAVIDKIDFNIYVISRNVLDNINNPYINLDKYTAQQFTENFNDINKSYVKETNTFKLNIATRLLMLSMLCHWLIKNNYHFALWRIADRYTPIEHQEPSEARQLSEVLATVDLCWQALYTDALNSKSFIRRFNHAEKFGILFKPKYALQHCANLATLAILLCYINPDLYTQCLDKFSILLEADQLNGQRLFNMLRFGKKHARNIGFVLSLVFLLGVLFAIGAEVSSFSDANIQKALAGIGFGLMCFGGSVLFPFLALAIVRLATFGVFYNMHRTLDETLLSIYTNTLLNDIANSQCTARCEQPARNNPGLFFAHGSTARQVQNTTTPFASAQQELVRIPSANASLSLNRV